MPIGLSPLSPVLSWNPFPPSVAVPIGLSLRSALAPPVLPGEGRGGDWVALDMGTLTGHSAGTMASLTTLHTAQPSVWVPDRPPCMTGLGSRLGRTMCSRLLTHLAEPLSLRRAMLVILWHSDAGRRQKDAA